MKKLLFTISATVFAIAAFAQSWLLVGNTGISDTSFIGTTDSKSLVFKVNNRRAGFLNGFSTNTSFGYNALLNSTNGSNTAIGHSALHMNTSGIANTATGYLSLYSNTSGYNNLANGYGALANNTTGHDNTATGNLTLSANTVNSYNTAYGSYALTNNVSYSNTAIGFGALRQNSSGSLNTAVGVNALTQNLNGTHNVAIGYDALKANTFGQTNNAVGFGALQANTSGNGNAAFGQEALYGNTTGGGNVAFGQRSMLVNTSGGSNTAIGSFALYRTSTANYNTALGASAAYGYDLGWNNTLLGAGSDVNAAGRYNCTAVGQGAICTGNSQARIGNSATVSIGGYAGWSNISDGRFKKNVKANAKGLEFILKLVPVTYFLDATALDAKLSGGKNVAANPAMQKALSEKEKILYSGFIAQDVEAAAKEVGFEFSGIDKPQDADDVYGLRYADFVVPLTKGMQEEQQMINEQKELVSQLIRQNTILQTRIEELERKMGISTVTKESLTIWPNPSSDKIYLIIDAMQQSKGVVTVSDTKGALIKYEQPALAVGSNQIAIDIKELAQGSYIIKAEWNNGQTRKSAALIKK